MVRLKKKTLAPAELEEDIKATIDELKEVNLGDIENPRPIYISASLTHGEEGTYIALLHEFKDVFAWSYKEMPGLDPKHHSCKKEEWANSSHEALSFMDGSSGYNQIRMAPADKELTAFRTPKVKDLRKVLERLRRYQLKMNPSKCAFGVTSGNFLGSSSASGANPLKYVMAKPALSDRLARWYLQLQQFEITYVPQKAVKEHVLADFLADHPMPAEWELSDDLPDEDVLVIEVTPPWKMYFDGASHKEGAGAGVVFVTSEGENSSSISRKDNKQADALAKLASTLSMTDKEARIPICKSWAIPPIFSDDEDDMLQEEDNQVTEVFEVEKKIGDNHWLIT
ncbi:UNVERIFIED_CONTAM: hypothetical protein Scaly_1022800 [Sesamum calycinum]|uniref:Reverse transcriptase/retrotransposon-derived protein RNase H-like domain-containing protein n=1 Tax=Sesamum calycinum TaxID=2727403 RepID=A0AAW2QJF0_9LAMI